MTDSDSRKEIYSAQTRQSRTALGLTSTTLIIYCLSGQHFNGNQSFRWPSGTFDVPIQLFPIILCASIIYFTFSFFISGLYDRKNLRLKKQIAPLRETIRVFQDAEQFLSENLNEAWINISKASARYQSQASDITDSELDRILASEHPESNTRQLISKIKNLLADLREDLKLQDVQSSLRENTKKNLSEIGNSIKMVEDSTATLEASFKGIPDAKINWLEFYAPILWAFVSLLAFFIGCALQLEAIRITHTPAGITNYSAVEVAFSELTNAVRTGDNDRYFDLFDQTNFTALNADGSVTHSFDEFRGAYLEQTAFIDSYRSLDFDNVKVSIIDARTAILINEYSAEVVLTSGDNVSAAGAGTQVWSLGAEGWKLFHISSSAKP